MMNLSFGRKGGGKSGMFGGDLEEGKSLSHGGFKEPYLHRAYIDFR